MITENVPVVTKILPELALNEVFVGELDSTAPSYIELSVNNSQKQKIKEIRAPSSCLPNTDLVTFWTSDPFW